MAIADPSRIVELLQRENQAPPELIDEAKKVVSQQMMGLALSDSVLSSILAGVMRHVYTTAFPTYAVMLGGDGFPILAINPEFAIKLGPDNGVFVVMHEMLHLYNKHLYVDPAMSKDERWTIASEACINHLVSQLLNRGLPEIDGEKTGVDPKSVYERYRDDLKKQGKDPIALSDFYRTDLGAYNELCKMTKPPKTKQMMCVHQDPNGSGDVGGQDLSDMLDLDQDEVDKLMRKALDVSMHEAKANGNRAAKEELLKLEERSKGSPKAEKIWGDIGLGSLRGETLRTRKTQYWQQWVQNIIASKLEEGFRLRYQRKIWWDPRLAYRGDEEKKRLLVAFDTSGSMHQEVLDWLVTKCGETDGLEILFGCFDGDFWPLEPGEPFQGGGGTSFHVIEDALNRLQDGQDLVSSNGKVTLRSGPIDAVLCVTDGYAPELTPKEPEKWIWLIVPGGSTWPESHTPTMDCYEIEPKE